VSGGQPEEVILEITRIGDVQRVAAVDVATGVEIVFQTPATAALGDVQALARQLLERKLAGDDKPAGPGVIA
jgi:hypothetical protein